MARRTQAAQRAIAALPVRARGITVRRYNCAVQGSIRMEYRNLGRSGLKVSPLCLGTMMFGDQTDARAAGRIVAAARDAGINFIDTADGYAKGESERILGRVLKKDRERWVVATKVAVPMGKGPNERGLSRRWMMQAIDQSLARLQMDHVKIWYLHQVDYETPLEENGRAACRERGGQYV